MGGSRIVIESFNKKLDSELFWIAFKFSRLRIDLDTSCGSSLIQSRFTIDKKIFEFVESEQSIFVMYA